MTKFKAGDKVRRLHSDFRSMKVGAVGTVKYDCTDGALFLEEYSGAFSANRFELVDTSRLRVGETYKDNIGVNVHILAQYPGKPDVFIGGTASRGEGGREMIGMLLYHVSGRYMGNDPNRSEKITGGAYDIELEKPLKYRDLKPGQFFTVAADTERRVRFKLHEGNILRNEHLHWTSNAELIIDVEVILVDPVPLPEYKG